MEEKRMIVALSGTPGTGKTTLGKHLARKYRVISVKDLALEMNCILAYDAERDSYEVNIPALKEYVNSYIKTRDETVILDGHLSHFLDPDYVIILRTKPSVLIERLKARGYSEDKVWENVEAEAIDLILVEATNTVPEERIFEIDTSDNDIDATARNVMEIVDAISDGNKKRIEELRERYSVGSIDWSEDFMGML